jgi:hypothetical protein
MIESAMDYGWKFMEERDPEWCDIFSEDDDMTREVRMKNRWTEYDKNPMGFLRDYRREHCYLCGCEPCVWREIKVFSVAEERESNRKNIHCMVLRNGESKWSNGRPNNCATGVSSLKNTPMVRLW